MMHSIDMHCDTLMAAAMKNVEDLSKADLREMPGCSIDFKRLHEARAMAQCFAIFFPPQEGLRQRSGLTDEQYLTACHQVFTQSLERNTDLILQARSAEDVRRNFAAGKPSAILTIEDSRAVDGKLENIKRFYDMGVRAMSLTWNGANCIGFPNSKDPELMNKGLTDFGKEAVAYMQELGILVDVSHLSDGGFYDVAKLCRKPFVATHSNCRALSPHQRNLTDEMLKILGDKGGVTGINFCSNFLAADISSEESPAKDMAAHARHMADKGGMDCVALGSDFDGIGSHLEVDSPLKMGLLEDELKKVGFNEDEIEKIAYKNVLRVMDEAMK